MISTAANRLMDPLPPYLMIKLPREQQKDRKEKIGSLYFPEAFAFMRRGLQFGIIEKIGTAAAEFFPQAKIGDIILINHFIEGKKHDNGYLVYQIDQDEDFNYYIVNAFELPGEKNLTYGISKGTEVTPNRDYIFLQVDKEEATTGIEVQSNLAGGGTLPVTMATQNGPGNLLIIKENKKSRTEWSDIMTSNMKRCQQLARNVPQSFSEEKAWMKDPRKREEMDYSLQEIKKLEAENARISKMINQRKYEVFKVAFVNPEWNDLVEEGYGERINPGESVYMLNIACHTEIEIFGKTYIVAEVKYFAGTESYFKKAVNDFNSVTRNNNASAPTVSNRRNEEVEH